MCYHETDAAAPSAKKYLTPCRYFDTIRNVKRGALADKRVQYFADLMKALASESRLRIIRILIQHGDHGCCVTEIQKEVGGANSTLSHHLETLARYGLVSARKEARWIFYSVNYLVLKELFNFLWQDCCSRSPELVQVEQNVSRFQ